MICKIGDRVRTTTDIRTKDFFVIETGYTGKIIGIHTNGRICVEFDTFINGGDGGKYTCVKGTGKDGFCWWVSPAEIEIIKNNKIVITTDGNETLARLYDGNKVIKTATAKCSPADAFNFETGAKIAFDRLFESKPAEDVKPPKIEVGERYAYNYFTRGIIEITEKYGTYYKYKIIKGMKADSETKVFEENSHFAKHLKHIEKPKYYNGKVVCIKSNDDDFTVGKVYEFIDGQTRDNDGDNRPTRKRRITSLDYFKINYEFIPFVE